MTIKRTFLKETEIEISDPQLAVIYKNMQGNILKGHGRDHATMLFVSFIKNKLTDVKIMLKDFTENNVTSFYKQLWERERYKRNKVPGNTFGSVFITSKGYSLLEKGKNKLDKDAFEEGMFKRANILNDDPKKFEGWHNDDIHVMFLLADDDKTRMDKLVIDLLEKWKDIFKINHIEYGDAIRNENMDGLEHNGYVDGISQPLFLKDEVKEYVKSNNIKRDKAKENEGFVFNPIKPIDLVLIHDPYVKGAQAQNSYGSYFVFRKLEQNVQAFKNQEKKIGEDLYKDEEDRERVGARLVGRFEDGTPIQIQGEDKLISSGTFNNFIYDGPLPTDDDPSGGRCPHFAHIRKTNPRENGKFDDHTMARRGIPYGHRNISTEIPNIQPQQFPTGGVGLLFMSYQKCIENQFEVIQNKYANKFDNKLGDDGVDPVIGQIKGKRNPYLFPDDGDVTKGVTLSHQFDPHVHFKGGEYFFTPSITYLKSL